jgi:hypothetical protein
MELPGWRAGTMEEFLSGTWSQAQDPDVTMANQLLNQIISDWNSVFHAETWGWENIAEERALGFAQVFTEYLHTYIL